MTLDRLIHCAYCKKAIPVGDDFYGVSFGTSSHAAFPMTSIIGVHYDCTYKIVDRWVRDHAVDIRKKFEARMEKRGKRK